MRVKEGRGWGSKTSCCRERLEKQQLGCEAGSVAATGQILAWYAIEQAFTGRHANENSRATKSNGEKRDIENEINKNKGKYLKKKRPTGDSHHTKQAHLQVRNKHVRTRIVERTEKKD